MKPENSQRTNTNMLNSSQLPSTVLDRSKVLESVQVNSSNYRYLDKNLTEQIDHAV